jgi:LysM repeat protein
MQNHQHPVSRFLMLAIIGLLALGLAGFAPAQFTLAQGPNLLQNPGFEGTYTPFAGDATRLVAPGWSAWNIPHKSTDPGFVNLAPEYRPAANPKRIHSGSSAQEFFTFFATHTGGVLQRVPVAAGDRLRFGAFINVWSTSFDNPDVSEQPGRVGIRVGIDPTGGTDGASRSIVWSDRQEFYDQFKEIVVEAVATTDFVTVFVESAPQDPVKNNNVYVDDASLSVIGQAPVPPSAQPTAVIPTAVIPTPIEPTLVATSPFVPSPEGTRTTPGAETPGPIPTVATVSFASPTPPVPGPTTSPVFPGKVVYTVVAGDTVIELAQRFSSTVDAIISANGLTAAGLIFVGQQLVIPVPVAPTATLPPVPPTTTPGQGGPAPVDSASLTGPTVNGIGTYIVQPGDDLEHIARRYNVTVQALAQLNGIVNPAQVVIGQVLVVPGPGNNYPGGSVPPTVIPTSMVPQVSTHVVAAGENLFRISLRYNVTLDALMRANGIVNPNLIYVGQVLRIP